VILPVADGFASTLHTFVNSGESAARKNVSWFHPGMNLSSSMPKQLASTFQIASSRTFKS